MVAGGGIAPTAKSANQEREQERAVDKATLPREPVRITGLKNKKKKFKFREKFQDDDEWVSGFTVTILNNSKKNITYLNVNLTFTRPENDETSAEPPLTYDLRFNPDPFFPEYALRDKSKVIKPGETFELVLPDEDYGHLKRILKEVKYPAGAKKIELMIRRVGFEDGTVWSGGSVFHPDPNKPGKFIREESPLGRARDRPADSYTRKLVMYTANEDVVSTCVLRRVNPCAGK